MTLCSGKSLLVLGGAEKTVPLVRHALARGHRVVLCDQNPANPCRTLASEFVEVSTIDRDAVLAAARARGASGVVAFGSDIMAVEAAWLAGQLGLPGNPSDAVDIMGRKDRFRAFLAEQGFPVPGCRSVEDMAVVNWPASGLRLPVIVKPVDGAGSTAVIRVDRWADLPPAFHAAQSASRSNRVIVEEFITRAHPHMIAGDAFVVDGRVTFWGLLDSHRAASAAPCLPTGTSWPVSLDAARQEQVRQQVQALVTALGLRFGPLNLELMFGEDSALYIIEVAARNGGNAIPELLAAATGVDLIAALVAASLGEPVDLRPNRQGGWLANYMIHSPVAGRFAGVEIAPRLAPYVEGMVLDVRPGDPVRAFDRAPHAIGTLWLRFPDAAIQQALLTRVPMLVTVCVKS